MSVISSNISKPARPTGSILLVEDEQVLRESIAQLLTEEGYEVVEAVDGQDAYEKGVDRAFDLVLTDIHMPRMDGLALLERLQRTAPDSQSTHTSWASPALRPLEA